jgi:N-acetylglucosaminyldiphosphoundecaprenol N-acetyl-beta-D-mannosaminyltransferase
VNACTVGATHVHPLSIDEAVVAVCGLATQPSSLPAVVFTPNIQHVVLCQRDASFRAAYDEADLVLPDGWPVAAAVRWLHGVRSTRTPGSELLPALCRAAARQGLSVGFVGGRTGAVEACASAMQAQYPGLRVAGAEPALPVFAVPSMMARDTARRAAAMNADLLFVGLGSPKGEDFVGTYRAELGAKVILAIGAAIDMAAGLVERAPESAQRAGLEWLYRTMQEPRRLAPRYARDAPRFAGLIAKQALTRALHAGSSPSAPHSPPRRTSPALG